MASSEQTVLWRIKRLLGVEHARISHPGLRMFLIVGRTRSTGDDIGQWIRNGRPIDFSYVEEKVVASGGDFNELMASARKYKRLLAGQGVFT